MIGRRRMGGLLALVLVSMAGQASGALREPGDEAAVALWLKNRLDRPHLRATGEPLPPVALAWADVTGDVRPEAFAYVGGDYCGSGGCHLYVLKVQTGGKVRMLGRLTIVHPPVALLPTRTHGVRDISVGACGGGIRRCYRARVRFDGWKYMSNPSMAEAVRGHAGEQVVIPASPEMKPLLAAAQRVAVPDARSAIHMARLAWMTAHPDLARAISSEADWENRMKATLKDGVWKVEESLPEGVVGGGVVISLTQADGRVLSMYTLQ